VGLRKSLLIVVVLGLMVLFLSPWTSSPVPAPKPQAVTEDQAVKPLPVSDLAAETEPAELTVAAVIDEEGFKRLQAQNDSFRLRHPEIGVAWLRIDPDAPSLLSAIRDSVREADVLLLPNEWIRELAVGGYLLPADSAYVGEALSEQFSAVVSQMRWNGYLWGVPLDMDPYVLVWNRNVLEALRTEGGEPDLVPPLGAEQWQNLPKRMADKGLIASWLAIDENDPLAFLGWLGAVTGRREDALFDRTDDIWSDPALDRALSLLAEQRSGIAAVKPEGAFWSAFAARRYAAAVVRSSEALRGIAALPDSAAAALRIDRAAWESPFVWPAGSSFAVSSRTEHEDAARAWMAEMSEADKQLQNYEKSGKLPTLRTLYEGVAGIPVPIADAGSRSFPNQPSLAAEPDLPALFLRLGGLYSKWLAGDLTVEAWKEQWLASLADAKTYD
jgi:maltose-binding protein MalE